MMNVASSYSTIDSWTSCHFLYDLSTEHFQYVPPSKWEHNNVNKHCFLDRNLSDEPSKYSSSAPGTALLQHWLSDFLQKENPTWNPHNDFPPMNVMKQYPDISDDGEVLIDDNAFVSARDYYTLWYTSRIHTPDVDVNLGSYQFEDKRRKRGHLTLHGVNYQPIVYFNGELLNPYSMNGEADVGGMFLRRRYYLGSFLEDVPLEILVLPPPVVGKPTSDSSQAKQTNLQSQLNNTASTLRMLATSQRDPTNEPQGQGGDHDIAQSGAIMQCTAGWDWIQPTPDRNTGIWDKVEIEWTWGDVCLHDIRVKVVEIFAYDGEESFNKEGLPLGDDALVVAVLDLSVTATLHSKDDNPINGKLQYEFMELNDPHVLKSGTIENITMDQSVAEFSFGQVQLSRAKLWWPHTFGSQPLYKVVITFQSDETDVDGSSMHEALTKSTFGIRTVTSYTHPNTKSLAVQVNGHPIFLVGGNWITTDQFLRFSTSQKRYTEELLHMRSIGFNAIRVWGGGITESEYFYNAADRLGILVYQEFWMTGDNNGRIAGSYDWPLDHNAYLWNAKDVIIRLRNHPSLIMYGAGNELLSSDAGESPPQDIDQGLRSYVNSLDGTRIYVSSSVTDIGPHFDPTRSLGPKDGPYGVLDESRFFDRNPGLTSPLLSQDEINSNILPSDVKDSDLPGRNIGFQTEIGSVSHPELASLQQFLTQGALRSYPGCGVKDEHSNTIHNEWIYYKYLPFTEHESGVDHICQFIYSSINATDNQMPSIEDYTWSAQLAQYFQYKSLFEGYSHRIFEDHSAIFLWKSSSPVPTFRGALYDWYLDTNGGYWGARSGIGNPLKVILNLKDWSIHVVNAGPIDVIAYSVQWNAYSLDGKLIENGEVEITNSSILRNSASHLQGQLPWVGADTTSAAADFRLPDVLLYHLAVTFDEPKRKMLTTSSGDRDASNLYFLTNPKHDQINNQSRYSSLGAMRWAQPKASIDASCTMQLDNVIRCCLKNNGGIVAIMVKLSLKSDKSHGSMKDSAGDDRILPAYFSINYVTMLPGESIDVQITVSETTVLCTEYESSHFMLFFDGWNVNANTVLVSCNISLIS